MQYMYLNKDDVIIISTIVLNMDRYGNMLNNYNREVYIIKKNKYKIY